MRKYKIGDTVWVVTKKYVDKTITCPDCAGSGYLTVIKGNGERVTIDCVGCAVGYEPPAGAINYAVHEIGAEQIIIDVVEESTRGIIYGENNFRFAQHLVFETEEAAKAESIILSAKEDAEKLAQINQKEKHNRSWAWNAHYHSREIKSLEKIIEYHRQKLNAANVRKGEAV